MSWIWQEDNEYDYSLKPGRLTFRDRLGKYRQVYGCSTLGVFDFEDALKELQAIALEAPDALTMDDLYRDHPRFRHLCVEILTLNGIDPEWVTPRQMKWLLFNRVEDGQIIEAPLHTLNRPAKPRHPSSGKTSGAVADRVAMIAAIASHCGGNIELAYQVASTRQAREVMGVMEESSWLQKSPEERRKQEFRAWTGQERAKLRERRKQLHRNSGEASPQPNPPR